jgi:hypothetical protein
VARCRQIAIAKDAFFPLTARRLPVPDDTIELRVAPGSAVRGRDSPG